MVGVGTSFMSGVSNVYVDRARKLPYTVESKEFIVMEDRDPTFIRGRIDDLLASPLCERKGASVYSCLGNKRCARASESVFGRLWIY